ncbi:MAG: hypothetical protein ACNA76_00015 [Anaerosomatales bacterium]
MVQGRRREREMGAAMQARELRLVASTLLILVGCLACGAAIAAHWVDSVLLDTDTFVEAFEPLARDEGVRRLTSARVSSAIVEGADLTARAEELLPEFAMPLAEQFIAQFEEVVRESVEGFVHSDLFGDVWVDSVRIWHGSFSEAVRGTSTEYLAFEQNAMRVAVAPYLAALESRVDSPVLQPVVRLAFDQVRDSRVTVFESRLLSRTVRVVRWLYHTQVTLWWIAAAGLLLGVAVAPRRLLAVTLGGLGVALAGAAPAVWVVTQRSTAQTVLGRLTGATADSSRVAYDALASPLLGWLLIAVGAGLAVAAVAGLAERVGISRRAVRQPE